MKEYLPRDLAVQLLTEAQRTPEREVCGLIAARDGTPQRLIPIENITTDPESLFEMAPQQQIKAMKQIRESGETLWAIYHSHPNAPAAPSARDLADAAYPEALYLVISLNTEGVMEMGGYRLEEGTFKTVALETALF